MAHFTRIDWHLVAEQVANSLHLVPLDGQVKRPDTVSVFELKVSPGMLKQLEHLDVTLIGSDADRVDAIVFRLVDREIEAKQFFDDFN